MTTKKVFENTFDRVLGPEGFRRRGLKWTKDAGEVTQMLELQKSQFGGQYYLNVALWINQFATPTNLEERKMHIRMRADGILQSIHREELAEALDLEGHCDTQERASRITTITGEKILPALQRWQTIDGLKASLLLGDFQDALIRIEARALLEQ